MAQNALILFLNFIILYQTVLIYASSWYLYYMVTQNMVRTHEGKKDFSNLKKIRFVTVLELIECLKQLK